MKKKLKKWFTLVELIVTILILSILWLIAFMSFQWYSQNARDSLRMSDISNIKKVVEFYYSEKSLYPIPTKYSNISYSWATVWMEWTFWEDTLTNVKHMSKAPYDPLKNNEYTFSVTNLLNSYQVWYALEWNSVFSRNNIFIEKTYASYDTMKSAITWNYNWKLLKVTTGWLDYILAVPTIITSDKSDPDIVNIIKNKKISYNWYKNLPSSYWYNWDENSNFDFSYWDSVIYEWHVNDLINQDNRLLFYKQLSDRYNESVLEWQEWYEEFSEVYADILNPTMEFINYSCKVTKELLKIKILCAWDEALDILSWSIAESWAVLVNWETNYIWQWTFWDVNNLGQWISNVNHDRSSMWISWALNKSIWVKWKVFTKTKAPSIYLWWRDVNWDGSDDLIYWYWWKIYLWDTVSWGNIWETKVLDIRAVLWVESILSDWSKSIIVALWNDWYLWVINWLNWNLDWISSSLNWPVKVVKPGWPWIDYKVFDINWDSINEYHFKQRYTKYNSFKFFEYWWKVIWETLRSSQGYWDYNEWSDWYQPQQWSMWNISWLSVVWSKWSHNFAFYSSNVNSWLEWIDKYKMPAFGKVFVWWNTWNWRNSWIGYFYDVNWDWNDEYISRINEELNNNKLSRVSVSWLSSTWVMVQYMSLSNPKDIDESWNIISYWNFSTPIALKNYWNLSDSYLLTYWRDPVDMSNKWLMLKYNWLWASWYKKNSLENESFNNSIVYDAFDSSYTVSWIYNNWFKDYVVLNKWWEFYFYTFNWTWTFLTTSTVKVPWSFYWNNFFDLWLDDRREKNKNAWVFLASSDTDWNGNKEFVVANSNYFKFYDITDTGSVLSKQFWPYNVVPSVIKRGLTLDKKDVYAISYNSTNNAINYYRTFSSSGSFTFTKTTNDNFYAWWEVKDMVISRLWLNDERYNKFMISWIWMFDARNATPWIPPIKLVNDFFYSADMDGDWDNEVFMSWLAYKFNSPWSYSLKYNGMWWAWDINWDWVLDNAWWYCGSKPWIPNNLFFTIRNWKDGSQIVPDLDRGNWNGNCAWWNVYSVVSEDFDWDWVDELASWVAARATRLISISWSILSEWNQLAWLWEKYTLTAFDFDWDWKKEIIRWMNNASIFKWNTSNKTQLTSLINIPWWVISTAWISWWIPSFYRLNGRTYIAFRWLDWQVSLKSWSSGTLTTHFNNYYLNTKIYSNSQSILDDKLIPLATADVLLWNFIWDTDSVQVLVWWGDGYIYIIWIDWKILKAYNIGSSIKRLIVWDTNEDKLLDVLVSAEDWYVYQIASSRIDPPSLIRDWLSRDINSQTDKKKVALNFFTVPWAQWYFVQLYNKTHKSIVFDWINIGQLTTACITSLDSPVAWCISAPKNFSLSTNSAYQWRVQSYNESISSPTALSNWFIIVN